jgi:hypothetical protein
MDSIKEFFELDWVAIILGIFVVMSTVITIYTIICKFSEIIKKPIGVAKQRKQDHELLLKTVQDLTELHNTHKEDTKQSIKHDEMIREDLQALTSTVKDISEKLEIMQEKIDATEMAKLKEKILGYYRKYKDIGEWQRFESDVFWGLYDRYISHGGNSFVKHDIEPTMRNLKVID